MTYFTMYGSIVDSGAFCAIGSETLVFTVSANGTSQDTLNRMGGVRTARLQLFGFF